MRLNRGFSIYTNYVNSVEDLLFNTEAIFIYGVTSEERSRLSFNIANVSCWEVTNETQNDFLINIDGNPVVVRFRDASSFANILKESGSKEIYIDITGLTHNTWANLLKFTLSFSQKVFIVYSEPITYVSGISPTQSKLFELSGERSIGPLASFSSLEEYPEDRVIFIPLLGFEGARFSYLREQTQPLDDKIVPIIGLPGFRLEFPFYCFQANREALEATRSYRKVRYATANCPFDLVHEILSLMDIHDGFFFKIAPIGTKPHALGAVILAIIKQQKVEIVYDHPIRLKNRTIGKARVLVYDISNFIKSVT